jgi:hypothetical protein
LSGAQTSAADNLATTLSLPKPLVESLSSMAMIWGGSKGNQPDPLDQLADQMAGALRGAGYGSQPKNEMIELISGSLKDSLGYTMPPGNVADLADKINKRLNDWEAGKGGAPSEFSRMLNGVQHVATTVAHAGDAAGHFVASHVPQGVAAVIVGGIVTGLVDAVAGAAAVAAVG